MTPRFSMLPPRLAPPMVAGVGVGKNAPPDTSTRDSTAFTTVMRYVELRVRTSTESSVVSSRRLIPAARSVAAAKSSSEIATGSDSRYGARPMVLSVLIYISMMHYSCPSHQDCDDFV